MIVVVVVRNQNFAVPVDDRFGRYRGGEAVRLAYDPGREDAARAPTGDEQIALVDISLGDHRVDAGDRISGGACGRSWETPLLRL